jgi:putative ABC transport system permease protein
MNPNWKQIVREHLTALRLPPEREIEIVEELALCFEAVYEEALAAGLSEAEAEARAVQGYDWRLLECELSRADQPLAARTLQPPLELIERKGGMQMESFIQDLRFGARMLLMKPGFTLIAVITLALGIGANTAIFSVMNAVLLRSLPYHDPDRLVMLSYYRATLLSDYATGAEFLEWRAQAKAFEQLAACRFDTVDLTGNDEPERLEVSYASADLFTTLGVTPALGRAFTPEEDTPGNAQAVILSDGFWRRRLGGDTQAIGQTLMLGGLQRTVVGIMPPGFRFAGNAELWLPLALDANQQLSRQGNAVRVKVVARLKPGFTLEAARAELVTILAGQQHSFLQSYRSFGDMQVRVVELSESLVGNVRRALWVLFGAVGFVLLIACANVANLLLARLMGRQKEMAIRAAIGARALRLVRQLLTESLLLALAGGAAGLLLARWGVKLLVALSPDWIARIKETNVDGRALAFTCGVVVLTGLLAGILPALQASKADVNETLKAQSSRIWQSGARRLAPALMITELALALVLLVGAGLMIKSFLRLLAVPKGFNPDGVLTVTLSPGIARYPFESPQREAYFRDALARVQALPGIRSAGLASLTPLQGGYSRAWFQIEGRAQFPQGQEPTVDENLISPEYLQTMGIKLLAGRTFTSQDGAAAPKVVLINETIARRFFPNENAVGKRLEFKTTKTIIGVVSDTRHLGLDQDARLEVYVPYTQPVNYWNQNLVLAARVADGQNNPAGLSSQIAAIRRQLRAAEPNEPVNEIVPLEQRLSDSRAVAGRRFQMLLFGVFAAVALVIATVGVYGVISYAVSQRAPEIGIRMALGAQASDVLRMVIWRGMRLALVGVALGLVAALALTRVMKTLLFNVSATDPATFGLIALLLLSVALTACYIPARRATKVDPLMALRLE